VPPAVSVVIPTYNKGPTLKAAVQSVLAQTYNDLEIVIVDDGSTDDTPERVKELGASVRYLRQDRAGVSTARNRGIEESQGRFVAFLDGDDLWLRHKLERQLDVFRREPRIDAVQCGAHLVNNRLDVLETRRCDPRQDTLMDFLLFRNLPGLGSTLVARRSRIEALGGFGADLVILEDWDLACRFARGGALRSLPECLTLYRQHGGNRSRNVGIHVQPGFRSLGRLFEDPTLDRAVRRREKRIWARFYAMLAGGYFQNLELGQALFWAGRALRSSPWVLGYVAGLPWRRLRRMMTLKRRLCFAEELPFGVMA